MFVLFILFLFHLFILSIFGLNFVQFMKNRRSFHSGIKQTPYRAMFGAEPRVGLTITLLPLGILGKIDYEDDL